MAHSAAGLLPWQKEVGVMLPQTVRAWAGCFRSSAVAVLVAIATSQAVAEGIQVALTPTCAVVDPGAEFVIRLEVPVAGPEFNAYDAIIGYDPDALTFLQLVPVSLQEGSYMKGACGLTFHLFSAAGDSLTINHSLLCGNPPVFLTGPGVLYELRFRASEEIQVTHVRFRFVQFYLAGVFAELESATDAAIGIGTDGCSTSAVGMAPGLHPIVQAVPNPFNPKTVIHLEVPQSGDQILAVRDVKGRLVRILERGHYAAGDRQVLWNGQDQLGRTVPSGVYLVTLEIGSYRTTERVVLLK